MKYFKPMKNVSLIFLSSSARPMWKSAVCNAKRTNKEKNVSMTNRINCFFAVFSLPSLYLCANDAKHRFVLCSECERSRCSKKIIQLFILFVFSVVFARVFEQGFASRESSTKNVSRVSLQSDQCDISKVSSKRNDAVLSRWRGNLSDPRERQSYYSPIIWYPLRQGQTMCFFLCFSLSNFVVRKVTCVVLLSLCTTASHLSFDFFSQVRSRILSATKDKLKSAFIFRHVGINESLLLEQPSDRQNGNH